MENPKDCSVKYPVPPENHMKKYDRSVEEENKWVKTQQVDLALEK